MAKQKSPMKGVTSREQRGQTYWYARIQGKKVYCGKGRKGRAVAVAAKSKEIARRFEDKEIHAGLRVKRTEFKPVEQLIDWYMNQPSIKKQVAYTNNKARANHLKAYFGKYPLHQVSGDDQERFREKQLTSGLKDGTIDNQIALLSAAYHMAAKRKLMPADFVPGEFVKVGKTVPRRKVTDAEYALLLEHSSSDSFRDILICGYESAMRRSEIMSLTRDQVHLDVRHISGNTLDYIDLGIFDTKTGARRTVPVSPALKPVLKRRIRGLSGESFVFTHKGHKCNKSWLWWSMQRTCDKAGIPCGDKVVNKKGERIGIVFHCLRHTRTSLWVEQGFSDEIVRRATGHQSLAAYQQYIKLDPNVVMRLVAGKNGTKTAQNPRKATGING